MNDTRTENYFSKSQSDDKTFCDSPDCDQKECTRNLRFTNTNYPFYTVYSHFYEVCSSYKKEEKDNGNSIIR